MQIGNLRRALVIVILVALNYFPGRAQFSPKNMEIGKPEGAVHLVSVGINDYLHLPAWNPESARPSDLRLAEKDAADIANAFQQLGSTGRFGHVVLHLLSGTEATKDNIETLVSEISMTQNDLLIVFFSGHGLLHNGSSYLIPYDFNPAKPNQLGIEVGAFTRMIASKQCSYLALFDACHSGKATEGSKDLSPAEIQQFHSQFNEGISAPQKTGIVITSSNAFQLSYEDQDLGNGVFTKAILDALANAEICDTFQNKKCYVPDRDKDKRVTILEFDQYVKQTVRIRSHLIGHDQQALSLTNAMGIDFPLFLVDHEQASGIPDNEKAMVKPIPVPAVDPAAKELESAMKRYLDDDLESAYPTLYKYRDHPSFTPANQRALGNCYMGGRGVEKNASEAEKYYRKAAEGGDATGQANLGMLYVQGNGGLAKDDLQALFWFRKSAAQGSKVGQYCLGTFYLSGRGGLPKNDAKAAELFKKSADQGDPGGQAQLGWMYELGWGGLERNEQEALRLYRLSAGQGNAFGELQLGNMYLKGIGGLQQNYQEAIIWYNKSAEQGYGLAQVSIGYMYQNGLGVVQDPFEAVKWYRKAANQGDPEGQNSLGLMYEYGQGVAWDRNEAIRLYRLSAAQGNQNAKINLRRLGIFVE